MQHTKWILIEQFCKVSSDNHRTLELQRQTYGELSVCQMFPQSVRLNGLCEIVLPQCVHCLLLLVGEIKSIKKFQFMCASCIVHTCIPHSMLTAKWKPICHSFVQLVFSTLKSTIVYTRTLTLTHTVGIKIVLQPESYKTKTDEQ